MNHDKDSIISATNISYFIKNLNNHIICFAVNNNRLYHFSEYPTNSLIYCQGHNINTIGRSIFLYPKHLLVSKDFLEWFNQQKAKASLYGYIS